MHIESALISTAVAVTLAVTQTGAATVAVKKVKDNTTPDAVRRSAVTGALVFALQMVNYTIPGTGSSGHIVGAILLSMLIGQWNAFLTMGVILAAQSLFFMDGGLLALGCNWFNMGLLPCLVVYPLFKRWLRGSDTAIALFAPVVSLLLGALAASAEIWLSGHSGLSFSELVGKMLLIHSAIGIGEGIITLAAVKAVSRAGERRFTAIMLAGALVAGCALSLVASAYPDGLEWSVAQVFGDIQAALPSDVLRRTLDRIQGTTAFMADYNLGIFGETAGRSISALIGIALTAIFTAFATALPRAFCQAGNK